MKICLFCYRGNPYCGGQGVYLYFLSRELARMGHSLTILVGRPEPWPMPWAKTILVENLNLWGVRNNIISPSAPWRILRPLNFFEFFATRFGFFPEMLIFSLRVLQLLKKTASGPLLRHLSRRAISRVWTLVDETFPSPPCHHSSSPIDH